MSAASAFFQSSVPLGASKGLPLVGSDFALQPFEPQENSYGSQRKCSLEWHLERRQGNDLHARAARLKDTQYCFSGAVCGGRRHAS